MNDFDDVKVGDTVVLEGDNSLSIKKVEKVNKDTFKAGDMLFKKSTGSHKIDTWHFIFAKKGTPENVAKAVATIKLHNRKRIVKSINFDTMTIEQLEKIIEIAGL